jgi:hypothetical protein
MKIESTNKTKKDRSKARSTHSDIMSKFKM